MNYNTHFIQERNVPTYKTDESHVQRLFYPQGQGWGCHHEQMQNFDIEPRDGSRQAFIVNDGEGDSRPIHLRSITNNNVVAAPATTTTQKEDEEDNLQWQTMLKFGNVLGSFPGPFVNLDHSVDSPPPLLAP